VKKTIDVCLSPELMHLYDVSQYSVVVVDILRATSCMTTAFAHGVESIFAFADLNDCLEMKSQGYFTAGERDGKKVKGFDLGNSPFEYMNADLKGQRIAYTTTNGTQVIARSVDAKEVIIASFLNLSAVAAHLTKNSTNVLIVCAGWKGRYSLEDTLFAGALVDKLPKDFSVNCDAALAATRMFSQAKANLLDYLKGSSHVQRLARLNIQKDIEFCLIPDQYDVVPVLKDGFLTIK
jgi:2-phosphosulfolactate phosphatase